MQIKVILTQHELKETGFDEDDLKEAIKELVDSGVYFSEMNVDVRVMDSVDKQRKLLPHE